MAASNRPYANRILPAWIWPSSAAAATAAAEDFERKKTVHEDTARQYRVTAGQLEQMTEGAMSEAMITEHQLLAVEHINIARIDDEFAAMGRRLAEMAHSLSAHLDDIDYEVQQEISSSPPARHAAIIAEAHAKAEAILAAFTADVVGVRAQAEKEVGQLAAGIIGRAPTDKGPTTQALSNEPQHRGEKSGSSGQTGLHNAGDAPGSRSGQGDPHVRGDISDLPDGPAVGGSPRGDPQLRGELLGGPIATGVPATPAPCAPLPSPLSGGAIGGGGAPSGGGGLSSGLGGGTSLSGLTPGLGNLSGGTTSPSGLSGGSATPGAVVDSSALSRAAAAGGAAAPVVSPISPAPPLPGPTSAAPPPTAGAVSAAPPALPAGLASAGAHNPIPAAMSGGNPMAASSPASGVMLPPTGMGGPAAQVPAGGATVPATVSTTSGGASAGSGGSVSANAAPTVVPASVVTPAAGAEGRVRPQPSVDVLAATRLAWELARAGDLRNYLLDWAVGKFRSSSGLETVVISNDGSGFLPEGVYLPRDVRLLVADPLVEQEFRDYWFGWQDPARVLVAYAGLRAAGNEWQLVAAASTGPLDALREAHIECGWADREHSPLASENWQPPGLDGLHVHRLEFEHPDLYGRLQRVANVEGPYHDRLMWPLASQLWAAARTSGVDVPLVLRSVWKILEANGEPSAEVWAEFGRELDRFSIVEVGVKRAGFGCASPEDDSSGREMYRAHWLMAGRWR
jgi:hypothetical protein